MQDPVSDIAVMSAEALCYLTEDKAPLMFLYDKFKNNDNVAYSALETLTWYPEQKKKVLLLTDKLEELLAENEVNKDNRMIVYLKIRSLLVNLDRLSIRDLYPKSDKERGKKLNINSRHFEYPKGMILSQE